MCVHMIVYVSLCTAVVHNTAQYSSDNFHSYPPDSHHSSDDVYWRGREGNNVVGEADDDNSAVTDRGAADKTTRD